MSDSSFISASILAANFCKLGEEIQRAVAAGIDYIHFDVMDHHFVPNLSFGAVVCESIRKNHIQTPIDVHLMVESPEKYIESFAKAGANIITFHPETTDVLSTLQLIHQNGMKGGLAFNPEKKFNIDQSLLPWLDMILIMTVSPGFAGQSFKNECLPKITAARQFIQNSGRQILLGVDGGIKSDNIDLVTQAGADFFVVGSGLFHAKDYAEKIKIMRKEIQLCKEKL